MVYLSVSACTVNSVIYDNYLSLVCRSCRASPSPGDLKEKEDCNKNLATQKEEDVYGNLVNQKKKD
jgi:hypothetical protein